MYKPKKKAPTTFSVKSYPTKEKNANLEMTTNNIKKKEKNSNGQQMALCNFCESFHA